MSKTLKLWRISNYADLRGIGGRIVAGRWHNAGLPIVYLAEHPALALIEILVHFELSATEAPENFQLLEISANPKLIMTLDDSILSENWQEDKELTQAIGDQWLQEQPSALLKVPSALTPHSYNYLFNPNHKEAKSVKIDNVYQHPFDERLHKK